MQYWGSHTIQTADKTASTSLPPSINESTADTKGPWVELIASVDHDTNWVELYAKMTDDQAAPTEGLIDIGIGASGSEIAVVENLPIQGKYSHTATSHSVLSGPFAIPSGTRIAVRGQTGDPSARIRFDAILASRTMEGLRPIPLKATTYGANTADGTGIRIDAGATANTKGAWVELIASTATDIRHLHIGLAMQGNTGARAGSFLLDVGVGASGSEVVVVPDLYILVHTNEACTPNHWDIPLQIPAGTRVAVRTQSTIIDATDRRLGAILTVF